MHVNDEHSIDHTIGKILENRECLICYLQSGKSLELHTITGWGKGKLLCQFLM